MYLFIANYYSERRHKTNSMINDARCMKIKEKPQNIEQPMWESQLTLVFY